jgi:RNA-directed DNA polymerase
VVDIDLEKFFDRVNHDKLMGKLAQRIGDKRLLKLIRAFLNAGVMENGLVEPTDEGTPQGGPLSPLLSNIVLDDLDKELERRGLHFVRYADDCNIYVRSQRAGERVMASISQYLTRKLKLKVNPHKSAVGKPQDRKFLGFRIMGTPEPKRYIAPQALERFKARVRQLTRRTRGISVKHRIEQLTPYLRGWKAYFGFCQTPWELRDLDSWIRRRLRCVFWTQWKCGRTRFKQLRKRGLSIADAAHAAGWYQGPWRGSLNRAIHKALPNTYFDSAGLIRLQPPSTA